MSAYSLKNTESSPNQFIHLKSIVHAFIQLAVFWSLNDKINFKNK